MKHIRFPLLLLILVLLLTACAEETPYTCTVDGYTVTVDPINRTITHGSDVYTYTVSRSENRAEYRIRYPDGSAYWYQRSGSMSAGGFDPGDGGRYISGMTLVSAIGKADASKQQINIDEVLPGLICGILFILLGVYNINHPEEMFYHQYGWAVKNAEPTEQFYNRVTVAGVLLIIGGIVVMLIAVF